MRGFAIAASLLAVTERRPCVCTGRSAARAAARPAQASAAGTSAAPGRGRTSACPAAGPVPGWRKDRPTSIYSAVFQESGDGKAGLNRVQALIAKKQTEGQDKQKQLAANQTKLQTSGS